MPSQHGFIEGRFCLTNVITFYDQMTHPVDKGKVVDVIYLDFRKSFDTLLQHSPVEEGLEGTLRWVKNWLKDCA